MAKRAFALFSPLFPPCFQPARPTRASRASARLKADGTSIQSVSSYELPQQSSRLEPAFCLNLVYRGRVDPVRIELLHHLSCFVAAFRNDGVTLNHRLNGSKCEIGWSCPFWRDRALEGPEYVVRTYSDERIHFSPEYATEYRVFTCLLYYSTPANCRVVEVQVVVHYFLRRGYTAI